MQHREWKLRVGHILEAVRKVIRYTHGMTHLPLSQRSFGASAEELVSKLRFYLDEHAGIVYAPQGTPIGQIVRGLVLVYQILDAEDMVCQVEFL